MQWSSGECEGEGGNNEIYKGINEIINSVIDNFFPKHPVYHIFPYFYNGSISTDSDFFHDNETPLSTTITYSSDELKTISHLSLFHKNRIAYDPKSVDKMLQSTGLIPWTDTVFDMGIYRRGHCGDSRYSIGKDDYFALPETSPKVILIDTDFKVETTYF